MDSNPEKTLAGAICEMEGRIEDTATETSGALRRAMRAGWLIETGRDANGVPIPPTAQEFGACVERATAVCADLTVDPQAFVAGLFALNGAHHALTDRDAEGVSTLDRIAATRR